jgi:hypothetical protein
MAISKKYISASNFLIINKFMTPQINRTVKERHAGRRHFFFPPATPPESQSRDEKCSFHDCLSAERENFILKMERLSTCDARLILTPAHARTNKQFEPRAATCWNHKEAVGEMIDKNVSFLGISRVNTQGRLKIVHVLKSRQCVGLFHIYYACTSWCYLNFMCAFSSKIAFNVLFEL